MAEIEIRDAASNTLARVAPERGGMVSGFTALGRDVLFLDRATFDDPTKNVRGGIPLLFPSPGKLEGDAWARDGSSGSLKQHGFARNLAWSVVAQSEASLTLRLESSDATLAGYPWRFRVDLTYRVRAATLSLQAHVTNLDARPMPFGFGTHGYFAIDSAGSFSIASAATRAYDNVAKHETSFDASTLRIGEREIDLHLVDHGTPSIGFGVDDVRIEIEAPEHHRWVLWSLPGRPFVCVEPWTCPGNALNTGTELITLAPGASRTIRETFRVRPGREG